MQHRAALRLTDLTQGQLHALLAAFSEQSEGEEKNSTLPRNGQGFLVAHSLRSSNSINGLIGNSSCVWAQYPGQNFKLWALSDKGSQTRT
jgi:hypothetical protein